MATVSDNGDVITEAGEVEEEGGAAGTSPLPLVDNNNQGDPPAYPGNSSHGDLGQEMTVMGKSAPVVTEPVVTFIARDETSENCSTNNYSYSLSLSTSVGTVYSTFSKEAGEPGEMWEVGGWEDGEAGETREDGRMGRPGRVGRWGLKGRGREGERGEGEGRAETNITFTK